MDPLTTAKEIYQSSLDALMAHTIRGVENKFRRYNLVLDLAITGRPFDGDIRGVLSTKLTGRQMQKFYPFGRVEAWIYINTRASKELARFTIAHEIYHLLLELDQWDQSGRQEWNKVEVTERLEADCDRFAQALCWLHDHKIYGDEESRRKHVHFSKELFESDLIRSDGKTVLPEKLALGQGTPFLEEVKQDLTNEIFPWLQSQPFKLEGD